MHKYSINIGSNYRRRENMPFARRRLLDLFPDILFAPELETEPFCIERAALFSNQVAIFSSEKEAEVINHELKKIERDAGRMPKDKARGVVSLDIDLLTYDELVLKSEDMQREYIQISLKYLEI